jgi:hypothetical protein
MGGDGVWGFAAAQRRGTGWGAFIQNKGGRVG